VDDVKERSCTLHCIANCKKLNCVDNVAAKKIGKSIPHDAGTGKTGCQKKDISNLAATTSKQGGVNLDETQST